jgi:hypothetical protein
MRGGGGWVLVVPALLLVGCGETDYSEGLEPPPSAGVPTAGPGSGDAMAANLHYMMQTRDPHTPFKDASCPDVPSAEPGATVTCEMTVGVDRQEFLLHMRDDGEWVVFDG